MKLSYWMFHELSAIENSRKNRGSNTLIYLSIFLYTCQPTYADKHTITMAYAASKLVGTKITKTAHAVIERSICSKKHR